MSRSLPRRFALTLALAVFAAPAAALGPDLTPLVSSAWLSEHLQDDDLTIIDIRSAFEFERGHIPGALQTDYPGHWRTDRDGVWSIIPEIGLLEAHVSELGIGAETSVVIVPAGIGINDLTAATWIYWMFKYLGHDRVAILDGGYDGWYFNGFREEEGVAVPPPPGDFAATLRPEIIADTDYVAERLGGETILIDARPEGHYTGTIVATELVPLPGHIPGAINIPNDLFYDRDAVRFAAQPVLEAQIPPELSDRTAPIIVYCSIGQASSMSWFVFHELLGYENVRLYEASMSEWVRTPGLPLVVGPNP